MLAIEFHLSVIIIFFLTFFFPLYKWVLWIYHILCFSSASYFSMIAFFFGGFWLSIYFMLMTFEHVEFGFNNNQSNWIFAMLLFLPY